jgi:uncharacterized membrane protein (UPF0127 family)
MNPLASERPRVTVMIADERFSLVVAESPQEIARGLMGVTELPADGGMLFRLDEWRDGDGFWMSGCVMPLDLAFLDSRGTVLARFTMPVEPMLAGEGLSEYWERLPRYRSPGKPAYAIEVRAGTWERLGVEAGDAILVDPATATDR